ncbi:MAG: hypothetical protein NZ602_03500 [Thermoguttaceae bacterium]|nr:hypothetical protein [Thermoguttaceae bacterium]MDW8037381.1 hypothetical protein [Thermoguttaceae bacterium]
MYPRDVSTLNFSDPDEMYIAWCLVKDSIWYALGILHDEPHPQTEAGSSTSDQPRAQFDWAVYACRRMDAVWSGWRTLAESVFGIDAACIEQVRASFPPDTKWWIIEKALMRISLDKAKERGWPIPDSDMCPYY